MIDMALNFWIKFEFLKYAVKVKRSDVGLAYPHERRNHEGYGCSSFNKLHELGYFIAPSTSVDVKPGELQERLRSNRSVVNLQRNFI